MCNPGEMHSGTVRNWLDSSRARRNGFIIPDIEGDDVFVHRQHVMNAPHLTAGDTVSYELQVNHRKNKLQVVNVCVLEPIADISVASRRHQSQLGHGWSSGSSQWTTQRDS